MHLTVERPALAAALKLATTAAGRIGADFVTLRATPDRLTVAAQGWDRAIDATIPADVQTLIAWHDETHRDASLFCSERPCRDAARDLR